MVNLAMILERTRGFQVVDQFPICAYQANGLFPRWKCAVIEAQSLQRPGGPHRRFADFQVKIAKRCHVVRDAPLSGTIGWWVWRTGTASIAIARSVLERELGLQGERLSVQLCIGIDEVVERIALLRRVEADVSSDGKLQAIVVMRPEEIILLVGVLPSFRRVNRDPAIGLDIELRPAVISRYRPIMLIRRQRKTNFEARRNSRRPHHADKQRVEISAVAALGRARPYRIAVAPTGARLIVAQGGDDEVVDCPRFREWVLE